MAALLWIAGVMSDGSDGPYFAGLALMVVGAFMAVAAWPAKRALGAAGMAVVAVGALLFYDSHVFLYGLASLAGGLYALGAAVVAVGLSRADARWRLAGAVVATIAAALWVYTDGAGAVEWQPGNVLAVVAWATVAFDARG